MIKPPGSALVLASVSDFRPCAVDRVYADDRLYRDRQRRSRPARSMMESASQSVVFRQEAAADFAASAETRPSSRRVKRQQSQTAAELSFRGYDLGQHDRARVLQALAKCLAPAEPPRAAAVP